MNTRTGTPVHFRRLCIALGAGAALIMLASVVTAQIPAAPAIVHAAPNKATAAPKSHAQSEGERVFEENCSRCHTSPDGFSQRVSGTIVRHMRVRASLSAHDEQALLRFFNPQ